MLPHTACTGLNLILPSPNCPVLDVIHILIMGSPLLPNEIPWCGSLSTKNNIIYILSTP